ncbi:MAG: transcription antitermination factor NusB [Bacteroidia bacterium]|nr:transcription antitermination factor NusB [Bacteroidia bacterium]
MLNRRILRIKAFKVLYSYAENPAMTLKEAQAQLEISCKSTRNLYLFMLSIIPAITREASARIDSARQKFNPTEEEKNPNLKFVNNSLAHIIDEDPDFQKVIVKEKLSWEQYDVLLRKLYDSIRSKDWFTAYMASPETSLSEEVKLFTRMYEEEFVDNQDLEDILEDLSIYWNDDLAYALTCCCRTLEGFAKGERWSLPPLYQSEMPGHKGQDSDQVFVTTLLRTAFNGYQSFFDKIASVVPKWDKDRLFIIDIVLIICGIAEAKGFPEIPVKVTINEYVDISKYYSTPKSRSFVNGILDSVIQVMIADGEIVKTGRGLI